MSKKQHLKIYLDNCCLNRPFDNQTQERIRFETDSIMAILKQSELGNISLVGSEILEWEINRAPDPMRKIQIKFLTLYFKEMIDLDEEIKIRAKELKAKGFKAIDALHLASAEKAGVDFFMTTDDRFLKLSEKLENDLKIKVINPILIIKEIFDL
ncbi:MAG: hypothetical protein A2161_16125 [Candidatus Schekmanbacteria bacterium RBG_13_48_7]|uniref:PIN domain-containing protein n=1 Tax=Candidatus Schekmanbacteria bacterium RBG_13_48_7 TaxID=1817878 RepID=A0A1F7RRT5_9BACT|nr:MAG: hypothetical protein A2161_16125 [Candidatus Schekmanbacteria bacterium RBG_13_48_7]